MIYTIGYDHLRLPQLHAVLGALGIATLVDVRSVPYSNQPGFRRSQLAAQLGKRYCWAGDTLGGRGIGVTPEGLAWLRDLSEQTSAMLLCKEEAPCDCHRYHTIALPLLAQFSIDCTHVFRRELVSTAELKASIEQQRDYAHTELILE